MTKKALSLLGYAPLMFLLNGFWMLSNRQMFQNIVNQVALSTQ